MPFSVSILALPTATPDAFISIDGFTPDRITNGALASKRYKLTFRGPRGHSYSNFGRVSPMHAMGRAIAHFTSLEVPAKPKATYNAGKIGGGTSINSIASVRVRCVFRRESSKRV